MQNNQENNFGLNLTIITVLIIYVIFFGWLIYHSFNLTNQKNTNTSSLSSVLTVDYDGNSDTNQLILTDLNEVQSICQCKKCVGCKNKYVIRSG
jgi:hypothetical protein